METLPALMTVENFFAGQDQSLQIYTAVWDAVQAAGLTEARVSKSQISFQRDKPFAAVWMPGQYLRGKGAPLVLTVYFGRRDPSQRWKEIVEPKPGRFTHHLELFSSSEVDDEVRGWLQEAWTAAG
jgi:hypothetical protein